MYFRIVILYDIHTHKKNLSTISLFNIILGSSFSQIEEAQYCSVGIHPWNTKDWKQKFERLKEFSLNKNVLAIGECGIDLSVESDIEHQKSVFIAQIELSEEIQKPLIIHAVRSYSEVLLVLKNMQRKQKCLLHAYNSSWQMAQDLLKQQNIYFSFGKQVLKVSAKLIEVIKKLPEDYLFIESDEHPELLLDIYKRIAEIRKISLEYLVSVQKDNFKNFLNINKK